MAMLQKITATMLVLLLATASQAEDVMEAEGPQGMEGRLIVRQLHELIESNAGYSREELKKRVPAFQQMYKEQIVPRMKELAVHISPAAMQWVDIDWDGEPEFIFWTEGLATPSVGLKEHLYVVKIDTNGEGYVMRSLPLDPGPSRSGFHYQYSRFWSEPNKGRDTNPEVRALLTYGSFGDINVAYTNIEIRWDPKQQKVMFNQFRTYFPVAVEGMAASVH